MGIRRPRAAFNAMSTPAFAMNRHFGIVGNCVMHTSLDISGRDVLRISPTGDHHEAISYFSCVSRQPRNCRGLNVPGGRGRQHESEERQLIEQFRQFEFIERRLLNAVRLNAQSAAGDRRGPVAFCITAPSRRSLHASRRKTPQIVRSAALRQASERKRVAIRRARLRWQSPGPRRCTSCTAQSGPACVATDTAPSSRDARRSCRAGGRAQSRRRWD